MEKILGIGNALVDVLVPVKDNCLVEEMGLKVGGMSLIDRNKFEAIQKTIKGMTKHLANGGSACNTIRSFALLGGGAGLIGKIGADEYGAFFQKSSVEAGVDCHLLASDLPTGVATTFYHTSGERTFGTYLGAAVELVADDITRDMFEGYSYLYVEGYLVQNHEMILRAMELAKQAGLHICLDMASYNIVEEEKEFFGLLISRYVDILFANEDEARAFTGKEAEKAAEELAQLCSIAIVKTGAKGAIIKKGTETIHAEAEKVPQVIDTTGAGDFYAAGFLYGLIGGLSLQKCAKCGSLLAGEVIQTVGTDLKPDTWARLKAKLGLVETE